MPYLNGRRYSEQKTTPKEGTTQVPRKSRRKQRHGELCFDKLGVEEVPVNRVTIHAKLTTDLFSRGNGSHFPRER